MRYVLALFALSVSLLGSAQGGVVNYGSLMGNTLFFNGISESSASIPVPFPDLFGPPTVMGNMLIFSPLNFEAKITGAGSATTQSILSMSLDAKPGFEISSVSFEEFGDYTAASPFTAGTAAISTLTSLTVGTGAGGGSFAANSGVVPGSNSGTWGISGPVAGITPGASLPFSATNVLTASATNDLSSAINKKKIFKITVETTPTGVIPEPASALIFLGLGACALPFYRRSR